MSQPYIGEIKMFGGNFAPAGWMFCQGQLLQISEYETLFTLIGTTYGGDGQTTFALPDLRGRLPLHFGSGLMLGEIGGVEAVTLMVSQMPAHSHAFVASTNNAAVANAGGNVLAHTPSYTPYMPTSPDTALNPASITAAGGGQPHTNLQPYLCINFIISLFGIYPSPS